MSTEPTTIEARPQPQATSSRSWVQTASNVARLLVILYVFIGALQIIKTGAGALDVFSSGGFLVHNAGSTLGLGWIGAMLTLSGSTAAAAAMGLTAAGSISEVQGFTMVTGARLGAAFVVLLIAALYVMRSGTQGRRRATVSTAVMALSITAVIYVPGALIGLSILKGPIAGVTLSAPPSFGNLIDLLYGWMLTPIETWSPALLFVGGVALLAISFRALDALVPAVDKEQFEGSRLSWLQRKWPMFLLGIAVVIATLSVSVALTVLVPLVAKGYVKRENLIPYIVGADLGTLVDKLLVAFVVGIGAPHPDAAVRIILAEIVGTAVVGLFVMTFVYMPFRRMVWRFQRKVTSGKGPLLAFTASVFIIPLATIVISGFVG